MQQLGSPSPAASPRGADAIGDAVRRRAAISTAFGVVGDELDAGCRCARSPSRRRRRRRAAATTRRGAASTRAPPRAARAGSSACASPPNSAWCSTSAASISSFDRQRRAIGQHQLPRRLALGERPVGDAVLGDQPRRGLRDARAVVARARRSRRRARPACRAAAVASRIEPARCLRAGVRRAGRGCPAPACAGQPGAEAFVAAARRELGEEVLADVPRVVAQPGLGVDAHGDDAVGHRQRAFRHALQRLLPCSRSRSAARPLPPVSLAPSVRGWSKPIHATPTSAAL